MKFYIILFLLAPFIANGQLPIFDQQKINSIYIYMPADSADAVYNNVLGKTYLKAKFIYTNGLQADTLDSVGIRIKGATSLLSGKKSFKISFNKYNDTLEYKGVRKLNLNGNHNDPSYVREKVFYDMYAKAGLQKRRISFIKLFINDVYYGIQSNVEEIDKQWLKDAYGDASGNLYKCSWGATLENKSTNANYYKGLMTGQERTYDLQTNESINNYNDLVKLILTINKTNNANYLKSLDSVFDWKEYTKIMAMDILTGNWDNYMYNSSNYCLYNDSVSGKFHFITIDTDNTFGIDWDGIDWGNRNPYTWVPTNRVRPLLNRLLNNTISKNLFTFYLDSLSKHIVNIDSARSLLDTLQNKLAPYVLADSFKTLDYAYSLAEFNASFNSATGAHVKYGIKPFLITRVSFIKQVLSVLDNNKENNFTIYPNPASNKIYSKQNFTRAQIFSLGFSLLKEEQKSSNTIDIGNLPAGSYWLILYSGNNKQAQLITKQ